MPVHPPDRTAQSHGVEGRKGLPVLQGRSPQPADGEVVDRHAHVQGSAGRRHAGLQHPHGIYPLRRHRAQLRRPLCLLRPLLARGRLRRGRLLIAGGGPLQRLWLLALGRRHLCDTGHHVVHARAHGLADGLSHAHYAVQEGGAWDEGHDQDGGRAEVPDGLRDAHGREGLLEVGVHALQRVGLRLEVQLTVEMLLGFADLLHLGRVQQADDQGDAGEVSLAALRYVGVLDLDHNVAAVLGQGCAVHLADAGRAYWLLAKVAEDVGYRPAQGLRDLLLHLLAGPRGAVPLHLLELPRVRRWQDAFWDEGQHLARLDVEAAQVNHELVDPGRILRVQLVVRAPLLLLRQLRMFGPLLQRLVLGDQRQEQRPRAQIPAE
mmetsp:Transcript_101160/g.311939  ORF Transcript_101160/g.311939 Transcript_101160/m.311939 type:complete len:377 (-) Transcript_101160:173-1303(-)